VGAGLRRTNLAAATLLSGFKDARRAFNTSGLASCFSTAPKSTPFALRGNDIALKIPTVAPVGLIHHAPCSRNPWYELLSGSFRVIICESVLEAGAMAEDRSKEEPVKAPAKDLSSEHPPEQETGDAPGKGEGAEARPKVGSEDVGQEGKAAEAPQKDDPADNVPKQAATEEPSPDPSSLEPSQKQIVGVPSKDASESARASRSIPLGQATARGLAGELQRMKEAVKTSAEETAEARRELYIARARSRALSKYTKILAIVSFLLMICVIAQIFMVDYLMR